MQQPLIQALQNLTSLALAGLTPEGLARALGVQVLAPFQVQSVYVRRLDERGALVPIACFGVPQTADVSPPATVRTWQPVLDELSCGRPLQLTTTQVATQMPGFDGSGLAGDYVVMLPLMPRGLLSGIATVCTEVEPEVPANASFWSIVANACALALAWRTEAEVPAPRRAPRPPTTRQERILDLVAEGLTNHQIALRLGYSESTIGHDLVDAYQRLGVRNREDAVVTMRRLADAPLPSSWSPCGDSWLPGPA